MGDLAPIVTALRPFTEYLLLESCKARRRLSLVRTAFEGLLDQGRQDHRWATYPERYSHPCPARFVARGRKAKK